MPSHPPLHHQCAGPPGAPWVTFLPGIGNDASFWVTQAEGLADRYQVLSFDPWGHGHSPAPPSPCGFADVMAGVRELWDALEIEGSHVVGLGFGGSVALGLAVHSPERVERVVACCCRARQPDDRREFWRQRRQAASKQGIGALADVTVDRWLSTDFRALHPEVDARLRTMMKRTSVAGYQAHVDAFIEMDFANRLGEIASPTLLVAAEHDHGGGPVEDMRHMAARIPCAELAVVAGCGHIVNHEAPEVVNALIRYFLRSEPAASVDLGTRHAGDCPPT